MHTVAVWDWEVHETCPVLWWVKREEPPSGWGAEKREEGGRREEGGKIEPPPSERPLLPMAFRAAEENGAPQGRAFRADPP